jgi:transposase
MPSAAAQLPDDPAALKAMIAALQAENAKVEETIARLKASLRAHEALVQALRLRIARLKKQRFGQSSEKIAREIEQLELALENLEVSQVGSEAEMPPEEDDEVTAPGAEDKTVTAPRRRKPRVTAATPRERIVLDPGESCPECGGALRLIGEDVSEILDLIAAKLKVVETARLNKSCRRCEHITQLPAPSRPIPRAMVGPALLACILVAKFDNHLPLYRQQEIFARMGADIPSSTLVDWCGQGVRVLAPLVKRIRSEVMKTDRLHADDTTIRVLDPSRRIEGLGKGVKEGRIWIYLRDDRPWEGTAPPGSAYFFSVDRKGEHPQKHLASFRGILQADAYTGFKSLYEPDESGQPRIREAACWAHLRRDFFDVHKETGSAIALEALKRIGDLYDIEAEITGQSAETRRAARQARSKPKVQAFKAWAEGQLKRIPGKSDLAKAFRYGLNRWESFCLFLDDGRVAIDNNPAERKMKPIALGRKNFLFVGSSDADGETLADAMTIIETPRTTGSIRRPTSPTSSPGSTITRSIGSTNCSHGTGRPWAPSRLRSREQRPKESLIRQDNRLRLVGRIGDQPLLVKPPKALPVKPFPGPPLIMQSQPQKAQNGFIDPVLINLHGASLP